MKPWALTGTDKHGNTVPVGSACLECATVHRDSWAMEGSFSDVSKECRNNEETNKRFDESAAVKRGEK
eukprot:3509894-Pyramimonas_sp.AAC.1